MLSGVWRSYSSVETGSLDKVFNLGNRRVETNKFLRRFAVYLTLLVSPAAWSAEPLTVAVAANLKYAFDELAAAYKRETGLEVKGVANSSGKITAQVKSGAPFDVFLSADSEYPNTLYQEGYAVAPARIYAYGLLVLWTRKGLDMSKGLQVLTDHAVRKVAISNPKVAPYGRAALESLDYYKLHAAVERKLVYAESIAQVNQYVDIKAADIGFTAKSIVLAPETAGKGEWVDVPRESYAPIAQGMVILKHGTQTNREAARKFFDFVLSEKARAIFSRYGYLLP